MPGGFKLIQLPKPQTDGDTQQSENGNTANTAGVDKPLSQKDVLFNSYRLATDLDANWLGVDTLNEGKDLSRSGSVEPGSSPELTCDEKMPSDESHEANSRQLESNLDIASEGLSSDDSDYCGEVDQDVSLRSLYLKLYFSYISRKISDPVIVLTAVVVKALKKKKKTCTLNVFSSGGASGH